MLFHDFDVMSVIPWFWRHISVNRVISVTNHIYHGSYSWNKLIRKIHGIYNTYLHDIKAKWNQTQVIIKTNKQTKNSLYNLYKTLCSFTWLFGYRPSPFVHSSPKTWETAFAIYFILLVVNFIWYHEKTSYLPQVTVKPYYSKNVALY